MDQSFYQKQTQSHFGTTSSSNSYSNLGVSQVSGKRPGNISEMYDSGPSAKAMRNVPAVQPIINDEEKFTINPFRKMVVQLHPHMKRKDIVNMAYLLELPDTFEEEMGPSRDPLLFFIRQATMAGKISLENLDLLVGALLILDKSEEVVKLVTDFQATYLQPAAGTVWRKTTLESDAAQKTLEKDFKNYWTKFKDWCNRQNIREAEKAPCKKVIEYLQSLTSSLKSQAIMNYYKGILQYHQDFKISDKNKIGMCMKEIKEQEKKMNN